MKRQVSTAGGTQPKWSHDGKERFYVAPDSTLMSVPMLKASHSTLDLGIPVALFQTRFDIPPVRGYNVSSDGRFLFRIPPSQGSAVTVIFNWTGPAK